MPPETDRDVEPPGAREAVTLAADVAQWARGEAAKQGASVDAFVDLVLRKSMARDRAYDAARAAGAALEPLAGQDTETPFQNAK